MVATLLIVLYSLLGIELNNPNAVSLFAMQYNTTLSISNP